MLKKIFNKNLVKSKNTILSYKNPTPLPNSIFTIQFQKFAYNKSFRSKNSNPVQFKYKIEEFNPKSSKYSLKNSEKIVEQPNQEEESPGVKIPKYLEIEEYNRMNNNGEEQSEDGQPRRGISLKGLKSGKRLTVIKPAFQKKMTLKEKGENKRQLLLEAEQKEKEIKKLPREERKLLENNETSLVRHEEKYIAAESLKYKQELMQIRKDKISEKKRIFNTENLVQFKQEERLSKRLARLGVTSRRQAEKMIEKGMIKIDGKTVTENVPVTDQTNIQVYSSNGYKTPINEATRVWLFYKPEGLVCTQNDEKGRMSIHKFLEAKKFPVKHFAVAVKKIILILFL
jgi:ribosomal protein S4